MSEPTAANEQPQHTTTIEITGNGLVNAAFENTEGPEGEPKPVTPPPQSHNNVQRPSVSPPQTPRPKTPPPQIPTEAVHMNGDTPHMNGEAKTNGVEFKSPGSENNKELTEAVNLELVNMQPYSNSIPIKKESTELDIGDPYDEYFVPVNQHKKYMRGEKLYVTQDKRRSLGGGKKKCCWGLLTVVVLGGIVAILLGVILTSQDSVLPYEESRNLNGKWASIGGGIVPTPPPSSTAQPPRQTTDMTEIYLNNLLQGEITIGNLEFTPGLASQNSSEFKNLAASLEGELKNALFDHQTLSYGSSDITVKVIEFRPGSVVVVYRVGWNFKDGIKNPPDPIDKEGLKTRLQEHLKSNEGFLYNYRLILQSLKSEEVPDICKIDNGGCSHDCIFNKTTLQNACSCEEEYVLNFDGKTCIISEHSESESASSEEATTIPTSEETQGHFESSEELHKQHSHSSEEPPEPVPTESEVSSNEEHEPAVNPESEVLPTTEPEASASPEPETSANPEPEVLENLKSETSVRPEPEISANTEPVMHSEVREITQESEPTIVSEEKPVTEQVKTYTTEMHIDSHSMDNYNIKSTSEPNILQEQITETVNSETVIPHNGYSGYRSTESVPHMMATEIPILMVDTELPSMVSESQAMNETEISHELELSVTTMNSNNLNTESVPQNYETTMLPEMIPNIEENSHEYHNYSTDLPGVTETMQEFSSSSTSSERLAKYNQLPEDNTHTTEHDLTIETTTLMNIIMPSSSKNILHNEEHPHPTTNLPSFTEQHDVIPIGTVPSDDGEIRNHEESVTSQNFENLMMSSSSTESITEKTFKEDNLPQEIVPTTGKPFSIWEKLENHEVPILNQSSEVKEINNIMVTTTMMPLTLVEEEKENLTINDSMSLHLNESELNFNTSMMNETPNNTNMTNSPKDNIEFSPTISGIDVDMTTVINLNQSSEHDTVIITTANPLLPMTLVETTTSNQTKNLPTSEEMEFISITTTERQPESNTAINSSIVSETTKEIKIEPDTAAPTTEMVSSSVQYNIEEISEEPKILKSEDSESQMAPTFLVGGENMPPIALTPNPDLFGPYSVDSTILPVTEQEELYEMKSFETSPPHDSSDKEKEFNHANNYDNNLDIDYNEEEKYSNYKLSKGKQEHATKRYKSIKLDENIREPQDNDADEQMHSHQIEEVPAPISVVETATKLADEVTTLFITEKMPMKLNEEERLLIQEVYTTMRPVVSEEMASAQKDNVDLIETTQIIESENSSAHPNKPKEKMVFETTGPVVSEINGAFETSTEQQTVANMNANVENENMFLENNPTTVDILPMIDTNLNESVPMTMMTESPSQSPRMEMMCDEGQFSCYDADACIMKSQQCDGVEDCKDGSDEEGCDVMNCGENFKCNDGSCLSKTLVCNGLQNCPDGNDELNCGSDANSEMTTVQMEQSDMTDTINTETPNEKSESSSMSYENLSLGKVEVSSSQPMPNSTPASLESEMTVQPQQPSTEHSVAVGSTEPFPSSSSPSSEMALMESVTTVQPEHSGEVSASAIEEMPSSTVSTTSHSPSLESVTTIHPEQPSSEEVVRFNEPMTTILPYMSSMSNDHSREEPVSDNQPSSTSTTSSIPSENLEPRNPDEASHMIISDMKNITEQEFNFSTENIITTLLPSSSSSTETPNTTKENIITTMESPTVRDHSSEMGGNTDMPSTAKPSTTTMEPSESIKESINPDFAIQPLLR